MLRPRLSCHYAWTRNGQPDGDIRIVTDSDKIWLVYRARNYASKKWKVISLQVPIIWTPCRFGGRRP
jgi:hypothetical protein